MKLPGLAMVAVQKIRLPIREDNHGWTTLWAVPNFRPSPLWQQNPTKHVAEFNGRPQRARHYFDTMPSEHFDAVDTVFCRLANRELQRGAENVTDIERVVLLVWHASGIIGNGGFRYFFECAVPLLATAQAYDRIGVEQAASILRRLEEFFPGRHIPDDYEERMAIVSRFCDEHTDLLNQLEREFYSTDGLMEQQLAGWIRVHHDVFHVTDAASTMH